jgi:hypothetical protein
MRRVQRFSDIIVDTKSRVQKPRLTWRPGTRQRCRGPSPEQQNVAPGAATQYLRVYLKVLERPLSEEASILIYH